MLLHLRRLFLAAGLFIIFCSDLHAQSNQNIDSLKRVINSNARATARDSALFWASWYYLNVNPDSAYWYAHKAYDYAKEIDCRPIEGFSLEIMGDVYLYKSNNPKALELLYRAQDVFDQLNDSLGRTAVNYDLGNLFFNDRDTAKAFNYWRLALQLAPATPLGYTVKSWASSNLGLAYHRLNQDVKALPYVMQAYSLTLKGSENKYVGTILDLLAGIQYNSGNYTQALAYSRAAAEQHAKNNNPNGIADSYLTDALVYQALGQKDSSFYYAKQALQLAQQMSIPSGIIKPGKILVDLFKNEAKYDSALKYQLLIDEAKDSVFSEEKIQQVQNIAFSEKLRQQEVLAAQQQYRNKLNIYALILGMVALLIVAAILFRNNKQKQKANILLQQQKDKTEQAYEDLKATQSQLIQSEKMASLGELTAGIAHEIQNPLNFVNNFSEVCIELADELKENLNSITLKEQDKNSIQEIVENLISNQQKIAQHGKRADAIVKGMLLHSRKNTGQKELTDINALADEYLRLSYHGLRAKDKSFHATIHTHFDTAIGKVNVIPQDIGRVLLNLYNNAFYAVNEKMKSIKGGYEPIVDVSTKRLNTAIEIRIKDNGNGIPKKVVDKVFQPFFTTKPTGEGTGLGLSLSYDIIKVHGGELKVATTEGEGAEFIIVLPV